MADALSGGDVASEQPISNVTPSLRFVSVDARAQASDFGGQLGQGFESVARGLDSAASTTMEISDKRDALYAENVATQAEVNFRQRLSQAQQAFTADPSKGMNYADTFKQQFNQYQQDIINGSSDMPDGAKAQVMTRLNRLGASMFGDALNLQSKSTTDWGIQTFQQVADTQNQIANMPGAKVTLNQDGSVSSSYDDARARLTDTLKTANGIVPTAMLREYNLKQHVELDKSEISTSAAQLGAGTTAMLISNGKLGTSLTEPQRYDMVQELNRQQKEDTTGKIRDWIQTNKDYTTRVQMGEQPDPQMIQNIHNKASDAFGDAGPAYAAKAVRNLSTASADSDAQTQLDQYYDKIGGELESKYPTKEAKQAFMQSLANPNHQTTPQEQLDAFNMSYLPYVRDNENPREALAKVQEAQGNFKQQVAQAVQVSTNRTALQGMSVDQLKDTQDSLDLTNPVDKAIAPFVRERIKQISNDPFTAAVTGDKATLGMLQQSDDLQKGSNRLSVSLQTNTNDAQAANLYQAAIGRAITLQKQINPNGTPAVMSKDSADHYVEQLKGAQSNTEFSQMLGGIQGRFGDYAPDAINQLINNPKNPLPPGLGLVSQNINETYVKDLFNSQMVGVGKDKKTGNPNPTYKDLFEQRNDAQSEKDIDSAISGNSTLSQYRAINSVISNDPDTLKMIGDTQQSVANYAKYLYLNPPPGSSYSANEAAETAVKTVIGQHVDFGTTNGVPYMISRDGAKGRYSDSDTASIKKELNFEQNTLASKYPMDFEPANKDTALGDLNSPGQVAATNFDVKDNSYWVTAPNGKGVTLYVKPTDSNSREGIPVKDSYRSFEDMLNDAKTKAPARMKTVGSDVDYSGAY